MTSTEIMLTAAYTEGYASGTGQTKAGPNPYEYGTDDFRYFVLGYNDGKNWVAEASAELCEFFGIN